MFTSATDFAQMNAITIAESPSAPQVVYLDFDGAATSYVNADLGVAIDNVTVDDSGFGDGDIAVIVDALNGMFDDVVFTSSLPADGEFSTIYIGVTSAFDEYGSFLGLAETIDSGNQIRDDSAFVLLDSSAPAELVVSVIAHETEHIVHGMDHGGEGLERFAEINVGPGQICKNSTLSNDRMNVYAGGQAQFTNVNAGGVMHVYSAGLAIVTLLNSGGNMSVYNLGHANNTTVYNGGCLVVENYGLANATTVCEGVMHVSNGGVANSATIYDSGYLIVANGGTVNSTIVSHVRLKGFMHVSNGGVANNTIIAGGVVNVYNGGVMSATTLNHSGWISVHSGGVVNTMILNNPRYVEVLTGGIANGVFVNGGREYNVSGGVANDTVVNSGGVLQLGTEGMFGALHTGLLQIAEGGVVSSTKTEYGKVFVVPTLDFTVAVQKDRNIPLVNHYDYIRFDEDALLFTLTVSGGEGYGRYALAGYASAFNSTVTVKTTSDAILGTLSVDGEAFVRDGKAYSLALDGSTLVLDIKDISPPTVSELTVGTPGKDGTAVVSIVASEELSEGLYSWNGGEWTELPEDMTLTVSEKGVVCFQLKDLADNVTTTEEYAINAFDVLLTNVKCQTDGSNAVVDWSGDGTMEWSRSYDARLSNGDGTVTVDVAAASGLELLNLPEDEMGVAVKPGKSDVWTELENALEIPDVSDDSSVAIAGAGNGMAEVMFARGGSVWGGGYRAWHAGGCDWGVAGQTVELEGKNLLDDIFIGSDDATLLLLTDDTNGDALFVDDIYSAFPDGIDIQARVAKIDEIRAGAGDDIVDLTSPRYKYVGVGLTVRGGGGDDVLWANGGDNRLFGDAGDDRIVGADGNDVLVGGIGDDVMHGGGGEDIFCFCGCWGNDTVEQLATGTVTLWFADGDESKWNVETLTYTEGDNSVAVTGVADVTLLFGNADERYDGLLAAGAFDAFTSERIFEKMAEAILIVA